MSKNSNVVVEVVKAMEPEKAFEVATKKAVEDVKKKTKHVVGFEYDPKKVVFLTSQTLTSELSQVFAVRKGIHKVWSSYRNNIVYHMNAINNLLDKDELTEEDKKSLAKHREDVRISQACYGYFKSLEDKKIRPVLDKIADTMYKPYVARVLNPQGYANSVKAFFKDNYDVEVHDSFVKLVTENIGARSMAIKNWDKGFVDNMTPTQYAVLFLDFMLQVALDKSILSCKIIKSTLDGTKLAEIEEFKNYVLAEKWNEDLTVKYMVGILVKVGANKLDKKKITVNSLKKDVVKVYKDAQKSGLFVAY